MHKHSKSRSPSPPGTSSPRPLFSRLPVGPARSSAPARLGQVVSRWARSGRVTTARDVRIPFVPHFDVIAGGSPNDQGETIWPRHVFLCSTARSNASMAACWCAWECFLEDYWNVDNEVST